MTLTKNMGILGTLVLNLFVAVSDASADRLYWTNNATGIVHRATLDGADIENVVTSVSNLSGVAVHVAADHVYWTNGQGIQRANLDGTDVQTLVTGLPGNLHCVSLDVVAGKMYWYDGGANTIQRANLDGTVVQTVVTLPAPGFLVLDVCAGQIYFQSEDKIRRVNTDGTGLVDLVSGLVNPRDIGLDVGNGKVYWTDQAAGKVQRADLDGSNIVDLIRAPVTSDDEEPIDQPYSLEIDAARGVMYFSDFATSKLHRAGLETPDGQTPDNRTDIETLVTGNRAAEIAVDDALIESCQAIPAVSEWGLILMTLLVLTAGTLVYTRRGPAQA